MICSRRRFQRSLDHILSSLFCLFWHLFSMDWVFHSCMWHRHRQTQTRAQTDSDRQTDRQTEEKKTIALALIPDLMCLGAVSNWVLDRNRNPEQVVAYQCCQCVIAASFSLLCRNFAVILCRVPRATTILFENKVGRKWLINKWKNECLNEWMDEWMNEWKNECKNKLMLKWVN